MECTKVKELLSEYIDSILDEESKKSVEEHLLTCRSCVEELASLKAYLGTISSLKKVEAPENFIESLHERLQKQSKFKDVIQKIFVPVKIKVPFEIVGVAATVLFAVYLVRTIQPVGVTTLTQLSKDEIVADKSVGGDELTGKRAVLPSEKIQQNQAPLSLTEKEKYALPAVVSKSTTAVSVELVLFIRPDSDIGYYVYDGSTEPKLKAGLVKERSKDMWKAESPRETGISRADVDEINRKALIPLKIENILESSGGRILSVAQDKDNTQLQSIYAEIPKGNYSTLLKSLNDLVEFQKPSPSVIKAEENLIQIRIKLIPSQ